MPAPAANAPVSWSLQLRRAYSDLSVLNKSRFALLALTILFVSAGAGLFAIQLAFREAEDSTVETYEVLLEAERVQTAFLDARRLLRNGLIGADASQIEPYVQQRRELDQMITELRQQLASDAAQQQRLQRLDAALQAWTRSFVSPTLEWMRRPELLRQRMTTPEGIAFITSDNASVDNVRRVLQEMEDIGRGQLQLRQDRMDDMAQYAYWTIAAGLILVLSGVLISLISVRRSLAEPLARLISLIPRLSSGEGVGDHIPYRKRRDEVGEFARALGEMQQLVGAHHREDWLKTQLGDLAGALQLADTHEEFGDTLLRLLCRALGAGYGVAWRWDDASETLHACAAYGISMGELAFSRFALGQGPVGQSAQERRSITLSPVPEAHFRILSGLGSALPQTLSFAPLVSRGEVVGVLEIASFAPLSGPASQLLDEVLAPSALAWQTLARSLRTRELLATTQHQAAELSASEEALRVQQEELRATNEALRARSQLLEEQGKRLQVSEEELRAQAEELRVANDALTERTQALKQRQDELEHARGELERKAQELERASRYKSEFLANMSHELRTPLNSLLILSKGLADNEDGNLNEEQIESAQIVHDAGQNLLHLINDILDLSKVEAGKMQLVLEEVSLTDFLALQRRNFQHVAQTRGLQLHLELSPDLPPTIFSDSTRLGQIVVNLLSNAFKFTARGGVTLRVARPADGTAMRLPGLTRETAVTFSIIDTGIGIAKEKLAAIFKPFEQADSGTSRRYGGTGLGLSIVNGMARLLGGEVIVTSDEGKGSCFALTVPERLTPSPESVAAAASTPPPPMRVVQRETTARESAFDAAAEAAQDEGEPPREAGDSESGATLLIVEDDPTFASTLSTLATRRHLRALITGRGRTALRIARSERLTGILLDLGLPDMSGWDVLEQLKADERTKHIPVHLISANDEASRAVAQGAVGYLIKPVTKDAVLGVLDKVGHGAKGSGDTQRRRRLLLVDDDLGSRVAVRKLLENEAVDIIEAVDGAQALTAMDAGRYDGLILDLGLPDISGFDLLDQLAAKGPLPPVVIYSGRELTDEENLRLRAYTESIVIKSERSPERLADEVSLFLHALPKPSPTPTPMPAAPMMEEAREIAGKQVLVVDDDMRNIFALSKTLRARGLNVVMAQDGHKALAQLEAHPNIDLVLMDIMMPVLDGYETIKLIRANPAWRTVPIIAVTAKAMVGDREKCLEAGANDYCSKPIDVDKLMSQIRVWI